MEQQDQELITAAQQSHVYYLIKWMLTHRRHAGGVCLD